MRKRISRLPAVALAKAGERVGESEGEDPMRRQNLLR